MAEKMTLDKMTVEMDVLWGRLKELELTLSRKLETSLKTTARKLKQSLSANADNNLDQLVISNEIRQELIQLTAYYKAEQRGFTGGNPEQDWLDAEAEVDYLLLEGHIPITEELEQDISDVDANEVLASIDIRETSQ